MHKQINRFEPSSVELSLSRFWFNGFVLFVC